MSQKEDVNKKMKTSMKKKKSKNKTKVKDSEVGVVKENIREIPTKYEAIMREAGPRYKEFFHSLSDSRWCLCILLYCSTLSQRYDARALCSEKC